MDTEEINDIVEDARNTKKNLQKKPSNYTVELSKDALLAFCDKVLKLGKELQKR